MKYGPTRHHRRSIRLPAYDYTQAGAYFVTVVTHQRQCLFGEIVDGQVLVSGYGKAVGEEWLRSTRIRPEIRLDAFVVMPNHIHGIVIMGETVGAHGRAPLHRVPLHRAPRSIGSFIAAFKSAAAKRINEVRGTPGLPLWQRNYYEHVVRDEEDLNRIRQYIIDNPGRWEDDVENPDVRRNAHRARARAAPGAP